MVLRQGTSVRAVSSCAIIILGFLLGLKEENQSLKVVEGEGEGESPIDTGEAAAMSISWLGVASGMLASLCVALYAIFTKRTLGFVGDNIWRLQYYNNLNAVLILSLLVLLKEGATLHEFQHWSSLYFWGLLFVAGVFGIAIGYVSSLQIQVTSPLTHNVSGTAKACAQTVLACLVFDESKSFWWWVSNVMVMSGSSGYTYVRMTEMKEKQEEAKKLIIIEQRESEV